MSLPAEMQDQTPVWKQWLSKLVSTIRVLSWISVGIMLYDFMAILWVLVSSNPDTEGSVFQFPLFWEYLNKLFSFISDMNIHISIVLLFFFFIGFFGFLGIFVQRRWLIKILCILIPLYTLLMSIIKLGR